jgi:hypothetical protein
MKRGIELARMTRAILVCLTAVLTVIGGVACASDDRSASPSLAPPNTPTSLAPTPIVMPDVVGMYWPDAEPKLRSLGWIGSLVKGPDEPASPGDRNRVLFQSPSAGERVNPDGQITLRFGS